MAKPECTCVNKRYHDDPLLTVIDCPLDAYEAAQERLADETRDERLIEKLITKKSQTETPKSEE